MLHLLKRHPVPIQAFFRHSLVLTYALPREVLQPLLPPGLTLDTFGDFGFLAIALVKTEGLRPLGAPPLLGRSFFLSGYRIFTRYTTSAGRHLRGLRILRSDTDSRLMALGGNILTHYQYRTAKVFFQESPADLQVRIETPSAEADLEVTARLGGEAPLPAGSPFTNAEEARHFAGPLPFTFDYEQETNSIILIKGVRKKWDPQAVAVDVTRNTFLDREPFKGANPILANAFHISAVPYHWERGRREALPANTKMGEAAF